MSPLVDPPLRFGFLLMPRYSLVAAACAIEALRLANQISDKPLFTWEILSPPGKTPLSSSQLSLGPQTAQGDPRAHDILIVNASYDAQAAVDLRLLAHLRLAAARGVILGGIETGSLVLARAGLLDGRRATCHWDEIDAAAERFPLVDFVQDIFVLERDRMTCAGGTTSLDLMLALIADRQGQTLADAVSRGFLHGDIRTGGEPQRAIVESRLRHADACVRRAVELVPDLAAAGGTAAELATAVGVSRRHLEKRFARWLGTSPASYLRRARLERARNLLALTDLSILEVSVACGFSSASRFSTAYRQQFGCSPTTSRRVSGASARAALAPDVGKA
jgi:AraC family transcriptional regulator, glycine betaine-responsive activator